jgi:hypothetical protein
MSQRLHIGPTQDRFYDCVLTGTGPGGATVQTNAAYKQAIREIEEICLSEQTSELRNLFRLGDALLAAQRALRCRYPAQAVDQIMCDLNKLHTITPPDRNRLSLAVRAAERYAPEMRERLIKRRVTRHDMEILASDRHQEEAAEWLEQILAGRLSPPYNLYRRVYDPLSGSARRVRQRRKRRPGTSAGGQVDNQADEYRPLVAIRLGGDEPEEQLQAALESLVGYLLLRRGLPVRTMFEEAMKRLNKLREGGT